MGGSILGHVKPQTINLVFVVCAIHAALKNNSIEWLARIWINCVQMERLIFLPRGLFFFSIVGAI